MLCMKPVLILQHLCADGPAYLANWLAEQHVAFDVRNTQMSSTVSVSPFRISIGLSHYGKSTGPPVLRHFKSAKVVPHGGKSTLSA